MSFQDLDGTTKTRQYKLEEVTDWTAIGRFIKLGGEEELRRAVSRTEREVEETDNVEAGSWVLSVTQRDRQSKGTQESIKVIDEISAERAVGILKRSILLQDAAETGDLDNYQVTRDVNMEGETVEEVIRCRPRKPDGTVAEELEWSLVVSTPKSKRKTPSTVRFEGTLTPTNSKATLEDEETVLRSKSGKGKGKKKGTSLTQVGLELGTRFIEPAVPDGTAEIRSRLQSWTGKREVVKGGTWGPEMTQESIDTYVLP